MGRLLGIDYGRVRVGVAISDETRFLARPLCCLENKKDFVEKLKHELKSYKVDAIVVGLPLLMSGKESPMTAEVKQFSEYLGKVIEIPIILWDERLTSAQVDRTLRDSGVNRKKRAEVNDTLAASLILQSYLDCKKDTHVN
jgi:putative Holliday junction resolvase